jgi:hypothetical protein
MSTDDQLARIIAKHRLDVAAARTAAEQEARSAEHARHDCEGPLRSVALPLLHEWAKRLAVEGYPAHVEDRLGCRPSSLVFRLAPRGGPDSALSLICEAGPVVRFSMSVDGQEVGDGPATPLGQLDSRIVADGLGRFVEEALAATISRRSDCGPPGR